MAFEVLLVEDNPADVYLMREALKRAELPHTLSVVEDGVKALAFLHRNGPFSDAPRPNLILLDWNLPRVTGREVLEQIKQDRELLDIPVVVLTTSNAADDVKGAYDLHANCFVTKPVNVFQFFDVIRDIQRFWVDIATLPGPGS